MFISLEFFSFYIFSIRQCIAISVILLSTKYIEEKNFFKFLLMIIIATLIHKTSALFILVYFLQNILVSSKNFLIFLCIAVVTFILKPYIMNSIMRIVFSQYTSRAIANTGYNLFLLMIFILMFVIYIMNSIKINLNEEKYWIERLSFNIFLFSILLQILALQKDIVARLVTDYYIYVIILLPNILTYIKDNKSRKIIKICTCFGLITLGTFFIMKYDSNMIYNFFWI